MAWPLPASCFSCARGRPGRPKPGNRLVTFLNCVFRPGRWDTEPGSLFRSYWPAEQARYQSRVAATAVACGVAVNGPNVAVNFEVSLTNGRSR